MTAAGLIAAGHRRAPRWCGSPCGPLRRVAATATRVSELPLHSGEVALPDRVPDADTDPRTEVGQVGAALNRMLGHVGSALHGPAGERDAGAPVRRRRQPRAAYAARLDPRLRRADPPRPRGAAGARHPARAGPDRVRGGPDDRPGGGPAAARPAGRGRPLSTRRTGPVAAGRGRGERRAGGRARPRVAAGAARRPGGRARRRARGCTRCWSTCWPTPVRTPRRAPPSPPGCGPATRARWVRLEVEDDGPGIPPSCSRMSSSASPAATPRARAAPGSTGLGLAIVQAVVAAHGGRVAVDSVPGRTVFTVHSADGAGAQAVPAAGRTAPGRTDSQPVHRLSTPS